MGLRREKSAKLKVQVLDQMLKLAGKKAFEELHVETLCGKVKISKVTFFKYFPQKEDLLLYFLRIWCLDRAVELRKRPKEGVQAILYLFDKLSETYETYPGLMLELVGYLSDAKRSPKPFPVKAEERKLLYPDFPDIEATEIFSVEQMLEKGVLEAIFRKEITRTTSTRDVTNLLTAVFFGSVVGAHLIQQTPMKLFIRKNVELILRGLQ